MEGVFFMDISSKKSLIYTKIYKTAQTGEVYLGIVGPVRTGKSTFIKRFYGSYGTSLYGRCT